MRLIDADSLKKETGKWLTNPTDSRLIADVIDNAPTIDPVRHGHWIKITPSCIYECSKCGKYVITCDIEAYKYCQRCGARMDGDNNAFI